MRVNGARPDHKFSSGTGTPLAHCGSFLADAANQLLGTWFAVSSEPLFAALFVSSQSNEVSFQPLRPSNRSSHFSCVSSPSFCVSSRSFCEIELSRVQVCNDFLQFWNHCFLHIGHGLFAWFSKSNMKTVWSVAEQVGAFHPIFSASTCFTFRFGTTKASAAYPGFHWLSLVW